MYIAILLRLNYILLQDMTQSDTHADGLNSCQSRSSAQKNISE